jgi:hypothetical protein
MNCVTQSKPNLRPWNATERVPTQGPPPREPASSACGRAQEKTTSLRDSPRSASSTRLLKRRGWAAGVCFDSSHVHQFAVVDNDSPCHHIPLNHSLGALVRATAAFGRRPILLDFSTSVVDLLRCRLVSRNLITVPEDAGSCLCRADHGDVGEIGGAEPGWRPGETIQPRSPRVVQGGTQGSCRPLLGTLPAVFRTR